MRSKVIVFGSSVVYSVYRRYSVWFEAMPKVQQIPSDGTPGKGEIQPDTNMDRVSFPETPFTIYYALGHDSMHGCRSAVHVEYLYMTVTEPMNPQYRRPQNSLVNASSGHELMETPLAIAPWYVGCKSSFHVQISKLKCVWILSYSQMYRPVPSALTGRHTSQPSWDQRQV